MPKLYEITDAYTPEETIDSLPVEQPLPTDRPRVIINTAEFDKPKEPSLWDNVGMAGVENKDTALSNLKSKASSAASGIADAIKYASELDQKFTSSVLNFPKKAYENSDDLVKGIKNLFGLDEENPRYQLWPEKVVREALTSAGDIAKPNPYPEGSEQYYEYEGRRQGGMVPAAMAISALAGSGGLGGTGAKAGEVALGATPFLRPALKHKEKLYKGKPGQEHQDIIPKELYEDFRQKAMSGEDLAEYNFGFINDKGHFLDREKALKYGIDTGLIDPHSGRFGALTTTLMADSSKPGTAIEAMAKSANPFYSAVEHTVKNIPQGKMTGDQWLGTLSNKPGVKPEEMDWTGLRSFLEENKGKPVTKAQIEEHLAANKVELKEVNKGGITERDRIVPDKIAQDKYKAEWDKQVAIVRPLRDKVDDFQRSLSEDDWIKARREWDTENKKLDAIHDKMVNDTIERAGGLNTPTKYHSYQLPGGENYREMLLTLPNKKSARIDELDNQIAELYARKPRGSANFATAEDNRLFGDLSAERNKLIKQENSYKSSHWDEPNILAHVRMNDRTVDGKKSLHLEEIQSDWHQQGREVGYKQEKTKDWKIIKTEDGYKIESEGVPIWEGVSEARANEVLADIKSRNVALDKGVPDAPFKKSWHELALKRMIREAAEKGYDRLSWTPGEAQAARYDLSKQLKELQYLKNEDGTYSIAGVTKDGGGFNHPEKVSASKLPDIVGKEMAEKIIKNEGKRARGHPANGGYFEGVDLKVGGEGMKGFYDQIIPKALEKLGKEHGVKVKKDKIITKDITKTVDDRYSVTGDKRIFNTRKEAEAVASEPIFYIDIPQSLKDTALNKGFPLFSSTPGYMFVPFEGDPFKDLK